MKRYRRVRRQHPIFSPLALLSTAVLITMLSLGIWVTGGRAFNPGDLSALNHSGEQIGGFNSHAEFSDDCHQCHKPFVGIAAARCEACHENITMQRQSGEGIHGRITPEQVMDCAACHQEHRGAEYDLLTAAIEDFDHNSTAFSLVQHTVDYEGHALICTGCHTTERTYTMEADVCIDCHQTAVPDFMTAHLDAYGSDCLICHDGTGTMTNLDHDQIFPLTGQHEIIECQACHINQVFEGTPTACADCHEEPLIHAGLFGLQCAACHSTDAWTPAQLTQHTFPLDHGGDGEVACATCHPATYTDYTCYNCHEHEEQDTIAEHLEEGISVTEMAACVSCHPTGREDEAEEFEHDD